MKILLNILLIVNGTFAQHIIPFASQNNLIELSVANTAPVDAANLTVEVKDAPQWLTFSNPKTEISNLKSNETSTAKFNFSVEKSAPVNKPEQVTFTISNSNGERWNKTLSLEVSPPDKFELFQNYPNPFNPSTMISYQLPIINHVTLKVYDAIGREVVTLVDEVKEAGYYSAPFTVSKFASGVYIYKLTSDRFKKAKKMMVVK